MVLSDTSFKVLVTNDMVRFVADDVGNDFSFVIDDEFSDIRYEAKYVNGQFLIFKFNENNDPVFLQEKELEWFRYSEILRKNVIDSLVKFGRERGLAEEISKGLESAERGKLDGQSTQVSHMIVYAKSEDMGFKYEIKCSFSKADTLTKKRLKAMDPTQRYTLLELVKNLQIKHKKAVSWFNTIPGNETIDTLMKRLKVSKMDQIVIVLNAGDNGITKSVKKK